MKNIISPYLYCLSYTKPLLFVLLWFNLSTITYAQIENCTDGIDNDGDGLVDCVDPDCDTEPSCSNIFSCQPILFQRYLDIFTQFNPTTLVYDTLLPLVPRIQGGYNTKDGYMYGVLSGGSSQELYQITRTGVLNLGNVAISPSSGYLNTFSSNAAVMDTSGFLYTIKNNNICKIDITNLTATCKTLNGNASRPFDCYFNPTDNLIYGLANNGDLYQYDFNGNNVTLVNNYAPPLSNGKWGAQWSDPNGNAFFYNNLTGDIWRAQIGLNGVLSNISIIATSPSFSNNDGFNCPLSNILNILLPIKLETFEINREKKGHVHLSWSTLSEQDNKGFEVERKLEHETQFTPIEFVFSKGNSKEPQHYSFLDLNTFEGVSYYRLRLLDTPEQFSKIKAIKGMPSKFNPISVYPNPAQYHLNILINQAGIVDQFMELKITNVLGKEVFLTTKLIHSYRPCPIENIQFLKKGVYVLHTKIGSAQTNTTKFIKE